MRRLIVTFLVCEVAYVASVRALARSFDGSRGHLELWWTLIRLVSAMVLMVLFVRLNRMSPWKADRIPARCAIAAGMFLAPILVGNMGFAGSERYLFAATGFVVALREELAYRGILQRFLTPRMGVVGSLCVSNIAFVLYHWGVQPFTLHYVLQIFLCGMILGVIYQISKSIILAVGLHFIYDAIDSFTPLLEPTFPPFACTVVLSLTLAALLLASK